MTSYQCELFLKYVFYLYLAGIITVVIIFRFFIFFICKVKIKFIFFYLIELKVKITFLGTIWIFMYFLHIWSCKIFIDFLCERFWHCHTDIWLWNHHISAWLWLFLSSLRTELHDESKCFSSSKLKYSFFFTQNFFHSINTLQRIIGVFLKHFSVYLIWLYIFETRLYDLYSFRVLRCFKLVFGFF